MRKSWGTLRQNSTYVSGNPNKGLNGYMALEDQARTKAGLV